MIRVPIKQIQEEVRQIPEGAWCTRDYAGSEQGWACTSIIGAGRSPRDIVFNNVSLLDLGPDDTFRTELADAMPATVALAEALPGEFVLYAHLSRLKPKCLIPVHNDGGSKPPKLETRKTVFWHVPILVNPACFLLQFYPGEPQPRLVYKREGQPFMFDTAINHVAVNAGFTDRVHLYVLKRLDEAALRAVVADLNGELQYEIEHGPES